jgi:nucleoid-associated protein EbfC
MMKNLTELMKQAGLMQARMAEMQSKLEGLIVEGQSGGGLVKVKMTAKSAVTSIEIDPSLMKADETEILEDLLIAALGDAKGKAEAVMASEMKVVTGGMPLPPGFGL